MLLLAKNVEKLFVNPMERNALFVASGSATIIQLHAVFVKRHIAETIFIRAAHYAKIMSAHHVFSHVRLATVLLVAIISSSVIIAGR